MSIIYGHSWLIREHSCLQYEQIGWFFRVNAAVSVDLLIFAGGKKYIMCTYNISLNDALVEQARPAFPDETALQQWMQEQISAALERFLSKRKEVESEQKAMVKESLTTAFNELHSGQAKKNARSLFAQ